MFGSVGRAIRAQVSAAGGCDGLFFSERLSPQSVRFACEKLQHEFRERIFSPAITLWVFLAQVLSADHSCREAVAKLNFWRLARSLRPCSPDTGSYCEARQRLPEALFKDLVRSTGQELAEKADAAWQWLGRVVKVVDGATVTMADTPENQCAYPQARTQAPGVGFPIARIVVIFSLAVGAVIDAAIGPYQGKRTGENNLFRGLLGCFLPGEIALADSYYASFWDFTLLAERKVDLVARSHHKRKLDFRSGRKLGRYDHVINYFKPTQRPAWLDRATYERLPDSIAIRHLHYSVEQPGFRTRAITLATTLLDAELYSVEELADLYRRRWQAELNLRSLKTPANGAPAHQETGYGPQRILGPPLGLQLDPRDHLGGGRCGRPCAPPTEFQRRATVPQCVLGHRRRRLPQRWPALRGAVVDDRHSPRRRPTRPH